MTRRLVVMRHAKAEVTAPSDHARALAPRGLADAEAAGRWLAEQGVRPHTVLVSDATRTLQTWEQVALGAGWPEGECRVVSTAALYVAGSDTLFDLIAETESDVSCLVVIGHNPTVGSVAELLDDGEGDVEASTTLLTRGFGTSTVAVFEVAGEWSGVAPGAGRLSAVHIPEG